MPTIFECKEKIKEIKKELIKRNIIFKYVKLELKIEQRTMDKLRSEIKYWQSVCKQIKS